MRFPGFEGEWKEKRTKKIAPLQRGFDLPTTEVIDGKYPVVYSNGIGRKHIDFKVKSPGVVTGRSGTIGKVTYVEEDFWPHNTSLWVTDFCDNHPKFIFYFYFNFRLDRYNAGSTVPTLNRNDVHFVKKFIPDLEEQRRIANFLSLLDKRIQTQNEIIENLNTQLKNLSYKIFSGKLRFKDEDGNNFSEWEKHKLSDVCNRVKIKNTIDNQNVLTISAQLGLVSQLEYFNKSVSAKNLTNYYLLTKNDFAYNKSYSNGYPMGAIKRLNNYDNGVVSTLYICFRFKKNISLDFIEHYFDSGLQNKELEKVAQEGARNHGLLNINLNDFFGIELILPSQLEQKKIARFLTAITKKIDTEKQLLEQFQNQKKYFLQNMFI